MRYCYYVMLNQDLGTKDLCLETKEGEKICFKVIARILHWDKYEKQLVKDFINIYIDIFESLAQEDDDGNISAPGPRDWEIGDFIQDIEYWRRTGKIRMEEETQRLQ